MVVIKRVSSLFLLSRRAVTLGLTGVVLCVGIVATFDVGYGVGGIVGEPTPISHLLPIVLGILIGMSATSSQPSLEQLAGTRLTVATNLAILGQTVLWSAVLFAGIVFSTAVQELPLPTSMYAMFVLTMMTSAGLALLSSIVFSPRLAWIVPGVFLIVTLVGQTEGNYLEPSVPYAWNIAVLEPSALTLTIATASYCGGVALWNALRYRRT